MLEMDITFLTLIPLTISGFITYRIAFCPCDCLMACTKASSLFLIGGLFLMTLVGFPIK